MGIFDLIRSLFGSGGSDDPETTDVPIEPERRATDDPGADGSDAPETDDAGEPAAAGTDAAASTDSMVEVPSSDPDTAAEPAEAGAGVTEHSGTETPATEAAEAAGPTPDDASTGTDGSSADFEATDEGTPDDAGDSDPVDDATADSVETISGIGPAYAERLADAGVETVPQLLDADPSDLAEATGISEKRIAGWLERAGE